MTGTCIAVLVALVEASLANDEESDSSDHHHTAGPDIPKILGRQDRDSTVSQTNEQSNQPGDPDRNDSAPWLAKNLRASRQITLGILPLYLKEIFA
jgi:hypothetical protein